METHIWDSVDAILILVVLFKLLFELLKGFLARTENNNVLGVAIFFSKFRLYLFDDEGVLNIRCFEAYKDWLFF